MKLLRKSLIGAAFLSVGAFQAFGQNLTATGTLTVNVVAEASIAVSSSPTLTETTANFGAPYTGNTTFSYKIRTSSGGTGGSITVKISTDFSPTGGPSVASPPTAGDALTYSCTVASGTACTAGTTASTTSATSVATFTKGQHSTAIAGDAGTVSWSLTNDPAYAVGSGYQAQALFTIATT